MKILCLILILTVVASCGSHVNEKKDDVITEEKAPNIDYQLPVKNYNGEDNILFAFIGEKISINQLPGSGPFLSENQFKAKYKIIEKIYGEFRNDTIEFLVFDHLGIPGFSKFKNVLLYTSADSGFYYHQKYMYNDVYLTKNGRWLVHIQDMIMNIKIT